MKVDSPSPMPRTCRHGTNKQGTHRSLYTPDMELLETDLSLDQGGEVNRPTRRAGGGRLSERAHSAPQNQYARLVGDVFVNRTTLLDASSLAG